jgi:hypothetical protein
MALRNSKPVVIVGKKGIDTDARATAASVDPSLEHRE